MSPIRSKMQNDTWSIDKILDEVDQEFIGGLSKFSTANQNSYFFRLFSSFVSGLILSESLKILVE